MQPFLLIIPILIPIIGGLLILFLPFRNRTQRRVYGEAVTVVTTILVWLLLAKVERVPVTLFEFAPNFTFTLQVDGLGSLFAGMVSLMWPLVMLYAFEYMEHDNQPNRFFSFYIMTYGVTLGITFSANMMTLYLFYEFLSLITIPLVTHYQNRESMYAGRKYAAYTVGGAALAFFAVVYSCIYADGAIFTHGGVFSGDLDTFAIQLSFLFGFFGFGTKAAIFPLHDWLPTASAAPTPVTALLHAVAVVNTGVFAIMRLTWYAYGPDLLRGTWLQMLCVAVSCFTLVYAAILALKERHFKKKLAYSTVSNLSYMVFGIMLLTESGLRAGMAHMLFHGIMKIALFMCAGAFMHQTHRAYVYELDGVGRKMPIVFVLYTLNAMALTGVPLFCGFVSKWYLFTAGAEEGSWMGLLGIVCLIISAFLCAMYTLPISVRAFFSGRKELYPDGSKSLEPGWLMLVPIGAFTAACIYFGVHSGWVMEFLGNISKGLL